MFELDMMDDDYEMSMATQPNLGEEAAAAMASRDGSSAGFKACRTTVQGWYPCLEMIGLVVGFKVLEMYGF